MKIETVNFGILDVDEDKIINFKEGLPGFQDEDKFVIVIGNGDTPLHFLQSLKTPDLFFIILNPFEIYSDYDFVLSDPVQEALKIEEPEDVLVYTLVTIPSRVEEMTTNLMAPLIINEREKLGKQIILDGDKYTTKHYVLAEDLRQGKEGS